jgi:glutamate-1-semialdehyde aminotransferase
MSKKIFIERGPKLWNKAKKIIPGGGMLLSKRSEMFLPNLWPSYFQKTKGCYVWDLDGNKFTDMSIMGIGTNSLGYSHDSVDSAVQDIVRLGNMSSFNCPEEVALAEKLIEINPWADMVRFARSGGEANAISIRIARAASGKDNVAFCGYHGWHDWYLSSNIADKDSLSDHLLDGLDTSGVPSILKGTSFPFIYNDYDGLLKLVKDQNIGVIKMEVQRNLPPENGFLEKVRKLATERGIVLIFDECTSGFRETFGGLHKKYKVEPDIAMYGKALGNGYAITAVIGRSEVMESAQSSFISSTFWTERIGPTAALACLKVMEELKSWEIITNIGYKAREGWKEIAANNNLDIEISGIPAISIFNFNSKNNLAYKTLITQEMLKQGYLAGNSLYACIEHEQFLAEYLGKLNDIFKLIRKCEDGDPITDLLDSEICHSGFKRLN